MLSMTSLPSPTLADGYRYRLECRVAPGDRAAVFVMLNPGTEREEDDDTGRHATRRRCMEFARTWGCGRLITVNLFAWRARRPRLLAMASDPVGPENDSHIVAAAHEAAASDGLLICAWGTHGCHRDRDRAVMRLLATTPAQPMALGTTANGSPRHPLYVRADRVPLPYCGRP